MSRGHVVSACHGRKQPKALYIKLKNGAVYRYPYLLTTGQQIKLCESIKENGRQVRLKYWTRVRKVPASVPPSVTA